MQSCPGPQVVVQFPQCDGSVVVSKHAPEQNVRPPPHMHAPDAQVVPLGQTVVQVPQWDESVVRFTQVPEQLV